MTDCPAPTEFRDGDKCELGSLEDEDETDDVDEDLKKLQISLEGGSGGSGWGDVTEDPSIADYLQYYKYVIGF